MPPYGEFAIGVMYHMRFPNSRRGFGTRQRMAQRAQTDPSGSLS
jgi:hypothetical protein